MSQIPIRSPCCMKRPYHFVGRGYDDVHWALLVDCFLLHGCVQAGIGDGTESHSRACPATRKSFLAAAV